MKVEEEKNYSRRIVEAYKMWKMLSADDFRRYANEEVHLTLEERRILHKIIETDDSDEAKRVRGEM